MRFTIVTPSFKQLDWLKLCIASVRDQGEGRIKDGGLGITEGEEPDTNSPFCIEHIVQDAGTPGIEEFAREQGAAFYQDGKEVFGGQRSVSDEVPGEYILKIYSEKDVGMYDAINRGLQKASGDICAYLNCDEQYLPETLSWVADYFSGQPKTDVLFGAAIVVKPDGSYVCDRRVMVPTRLHTMVSGNLSVFTSSTFFRKSAIIERGLLFDPQWKVVGDAVWMLKLLEVKVRMAATDRPLSVFTETGGNLSADSSADFERSALANRAPFLARFFRPLILLNYRICRWRSGAYDLHPHRYAIFTTDECSHRCHFDVDSPTFRWKMKAF